MVVLNALALGAFFINLYIPKWPSLLQTGIVNLVALLSGMFRKKSESREEFSNSEPDLPLEKTEKVAPEAAMNEPETAMAAPEALVAEPETSPPVSEVAAFAESPRSSATELSEPKPESMTAFEEPPPADLSALEASLQQALGSGEETSNAENISEPPTPEPDQTPPIENTTTPIEAPKQEEPEGLSDLTEPIPRPEFTSEPEIKTPEPETKKLSPESLESQVLPEKTESDETKEEVKVDQAPALDDLLSMPIEETEESLVFDASALDFDESDNDQKGPS